MEIVISWRPIKYTYAISVHWVSRRLWGKKKYMTHYLIILLYISLWFFLLLMAFHYINMKLPQLVYAFTHFWTFALSHFFFCYYEQRHYKHSHTSIFVDICCYFFRKCLGGYCCQTLFQSSWTILCSYQPCMSSNCFTFFVNIGYQCF